MVRGCHVCVSHGAHAMVTVVLNVGEDVAPGCAQCSVAFVYRKMFVNIRSGCIVFTLPVGAGRLPSAVTDLFTIKILNSLLVETLSANR